jgi:hypothetical protein
MPDVQVDEQQQQQQQSDAQQAVNAKPVIERKLLGNALFFICFFK